MVVLGLVGVQGIEAQSESDHSHDSVNTVAGDEDLGDRFHVKVAIDLAQLSQHEVPVTDDVVPKADLVDGVESQQPAQDVPVVHVLVQSLTWLEGEIEVTYHELDLILHSLHDIKHPLLLILQVLGFLGIAVIVSTLFLGSASVSQRAVRVLEDDVVLGVQGLSPIFCVIAGNLVFVPDQVVIFLELDVLVFVIELIVVVLLLFLF